MALFIKAAQFLSQTITGSFYVFSAFLVDFEARIFKFCVSRHPVQQQQQISIQFNVRSEKTSQLRKENRKIAGANKANKNEIGEVEGFVIQNNLASYADGFINAGCDDM